jgi:hypothetical protein
MLCRIRSTSRLCGWESVLYSAVIATGRQGSCWAEVSDRLTGDGLFRMGDRLRVSCRVRGHEKVPTGGQVEVPAGGQIKVPAPCSSCRSGTAGPGGDGEGANHSSSPPGSSIEVCEGTHGHHFCLSTSRVVPSCLTRDSDHYIVRMPGTQGGSMDEGSALRVLLDGVVELPDLTATWLSIATELLRFAAAHMPSSSSWEGLAPGEPEDTLIVVSAAAQAALTVDAEPQLSHATKHDRATLRTVGLQQLADAPFHADLNEATVALGLADAIDSLVGHTFLPWFKDEGEVVVGEGTVYPVREHDPRRWLGDNPANTQPSHFPTRELMSTARLRVATAEAVEFRYILDFKSWDILSDLGASKELVAAVGQPNGDLDEFQIELSDVPPPTYANHGPTEHGSHAHFVGQLIAGAAGAEILVLPEYGLASASRDLLIAWLTDNGTAPRLVISGVSSGTDDDGYIVNDAVMVVTTPAGGVSRVINLPRKIFPAQVGGYKERIRHGSEVRVFLTESWTMATLICFDSMNAEIISQLADFGVNLLFVVALSEKSAAIVGSATSLCHRSQAFVVIATGPARWVSATMGIDAPDELRSEAVFAGPYAATDGAQVTMSESDAHVVDRPNLWKFNYTKRVLTSCVCNS